MIGAAARSALEAALGEQIAFDVPMARHTSLRLGGPADALATPTDRSHLRAVLAICRERGIGHMLLGAGFNTLVSDTGVDGVVITASAISIASDNGIGFLNRSASRESQVPVPGHRSIAKSIPPAYH